jgi:hypothetical protein
MRGFLPDDTPSEDESDEEKARPLAERSAKARRKREPRTTSNAEYLESPAGDKKCGAKKADGTRCGLAAGWNTDHVGYGPCAYHMGSTPAGRKTAATEMAEELQVFYGLPVDTNPVEALLDEVSRTAGHVLWLGQVIASFDVDLTEIEVDQKTGKTIKKPAGLSPEIEGWLRQYLSERAHLVRTSKAALDAGVNQRLVDIAEAQAERLADGVEAILNRLGLSSEQRALVPQVVPQVLRQLSGGSLKPLEGVLEDDLPRP